MSATNITNPESDEGMESTLAPSSNEDLGSLGVKTSDSTEPHTSSRSSSAIQNMHVPQPSGVQTRSADHKLPKFDYAGTDVTSFKHLHKIIYQIITQKSEIQLGCPKLSPSFQKLPLTGQCYHVEIHHVST